MHCSQDALLTGHAPLTIARAPQVWLDGAVARLVVGSRDPNAAQCALVRAPPGSGPRGAAAPAPASLVWPAALARPPARAAGCARCLLAHLLRVPGALAPPECEPRSASQSCANITYPSPDQGRGGAQTLHRTHAAVTGAHVTGDSNGPVLHLRPVRRGVAAPPACGCCGLPASPGKQRRPAPLLAMLVCGQTATGRARAMLSLFGLPTCLLRAR